MTKNHLWINKKTEWELFVQSWDKNDSRYQKHDNLHWTVCYKKNCTTHESEKQEEYYFQASKKYHKKKKMKWATWNVKKSKIVHQIDKLSEKLNNKSKFLRTEQKKLKEKMKITLFWWKKKSFIIWNQ